MASTAPDQTRRVWSSYQEAIFAEFESGTTNVVVRARAGAGKTTTILRALNYLPDRGRVLLVAFNRSVAAELAQRAPRSVEVKTMHAAGRALIGRAFGNVPVDELKTKKIVHDVLVEAGRTRLNRAGKMEPIGLGRVVKLVGLAKATLAFDIKQLIELAIEHDIDDDDDFRLPEVAVLAVQTLERCKSSLHSIDYDDMVWLPAVLGLRPQIYDLVVVDEAQDVNPAQIELIRGLIRPNGRIAAVGDDRQAIYAFRGAGSGSMDRLTEGAPVKEYPLSITYRCPKAVVRYVQPIVPDFQAAPEAPEGVLRVCRLDSKDFAPQIGDFVISRSNAPLVRVALQLLSRGRPAVIAGRDIAKHLIRTMERSKATDVLDMLVWLRGYTVREQEKMLALEKPAKAEELHDIEQAITALSQGEELVADVITKAMTLFGDGDKHAVIVCTTTHKAKGLERDRVWMLTETYKDRSQEDLNLRYVAATRAKQELVLVTGLEEATDAT